MSRYNESYVAHVGVNCAPSRGISGAFYPRQFVSTQKDWLVKVAASIREAGDLFEEANSAYRESNNVCPVGRLDVSEKDGYVYLYVLGSFGDWESMWFTTRKIAGTNWMDAAKNLPREALRDYYASIGQFPLYEA